jgi:hypothetical protein
MSNCDFYYLNKSKKCNEHYHNFTGFKKFNDCNANTDSHMKQLGVLNINQTNPLSEKELILLRLGLELDNNKFDEMEICPVHRATLGICWRGTSVCSYSEHKSISNMKTIKCKLNIELARKVNKLANNSNKIFYQIGSKFCKKCFDKLIVDINLADKNLTKQVKQIESKSTNFKRKLDYFVIISVIEKKFLHREN